MGYTILRPKEHAEWLQLREKGIGSSEVGTILGLNPFQTAYQLWLRKTGKSEPVEENEAMLMGHLLEDAVAQRWAIETGLQVIKSSAGDWIAVDNERDFLRVSPDRIYWLSDKHSNGNKGILECKTTQLEVDPDNIPAHWYVQLQYQLGVMGYKKGYLAWLTRGRKFGCKEIIFDKKLYAYLVDSIEKFVTENLLGGKEPEAANVEDVMLKYPVSFSDPIEASPELMEAVNKLRIVKPQLDFLTARKKDAEDKIKTLMGGHDSVVLPGTLEENPKVVCTWRTAKASDKFDEKAFKAENPDLYAKYVHPVQGSRRFLLK